MNGILRLYFLHLDVKIHQLREQSELKFVWVSKMVVHTSVSKPGYDDTSLRKFNDIFLS